MRQKEDYQCLGIYISLLYLVTWLVLLAETFRTLMFLPPDAFVPTWVFNIPDVSRMSGMRPSSQKRFLSLSFDFHLSVAFDELL
jgi:hypothetical protein